ncbi:aldehyde dehydrogenase family protein [Acidocella aminolytica]|jgi:aldehyde dehydrogenase (NAD+)|uniref:Aldehyde dehydrogenase n=1 Tax=Acidocella aminolytica 101 = DSM 11237 TaxID=1120923 RepID=A0A0D6PFY4_9PROT|nr:aldehyde dehydrogenase family protein [Acidocella aminolytica]GAN80645.1 aldehyde dehydrogenase [Acidocella aminolytica 101 = DSM 11237]SHE55249.1 aldehyde dehydrogenase (NAD+) [Acidocella aminolytica 101 = DSM 11237]
MPDHLKFYINGAWVDPVVPNRIPVIDPSTEEVFTEISGGSAVDVDKAAAAAKAAFRSYSRFSRKERLELMEACLAAYNKRYDEIAEACAKEMGSPIGFAKEAQAWVGQQHFMATIEKLKTFEFSEKRGSTMVVKEPIGVCGLITPWNWPLNQIVCKVAPALAAGCTMVLKPSEIAPINALIFAEAMHEAGVPAGVFNLVNGTGPEVGQVMAGHPDVDMMSFTGSTRAGTIVAREAAATVKRVCQELGGKSANILLDDVDLDSAVRQGIGACFINTGQSCDAATRMLVPVSLHDKAVEIAVDEANKQTPGPAFAKGTVLGPLVSQMQWDKVQRLIQAGIDEGATLACGGTGRPDGLNKGYFVKPTVFANVKPGMTIEKEEIFGPVLSIMPYDTLDEAVEMANDTVYGLAAYVQGKDIEKVRNVAAQMRAGSVFLNYPDMDFYSSFGGYKQSGNGREYADWAMHDFLEIKSIVGYGG